MKTLITIMLVLFLSPVAAQSSGGYEKSGGYNRSGGYDRSGGYEKSGGYNRSGGYEKSGGYNRSGGYESFKGKSYSETPARSRRTRQSLYAEQLRKPGKKESSWLEKQSKKQRTTNLDTLNRTQQKMGGQYQYLNW